MILTSGESSMSLSTGTVALQSFAVESIPYVTNTGRVGCGITPLHVEWSAFRNETTDPENLSYTQAWPESEPVQMYSSFGPAYLAFCNER